MRRLWLLLCTLSLLCLGVTMAPTRARAGAEIVIGKSANVTEAPVGRKVTYTILVLNVGDERSKEQELVDVSALKIVEGSVYSPSGGRFQLSDDRKSLSARIGPLPPYSALVFFYDAEVNADSPSPAVNEVSIRNVGATFFSEKAKVSIQVVDKPSLVPQLDLNILPLPASVGKPLTVVVGFGRNVDARTLDATINLGGPRPSQISIIMPNVAKITFGEKQLLQVPDLTSPNVMFVFGSNLGAEGVTVVAAQPFQMASKARGEIVQLKEYTRHPVFPPEGQEFLRESLDRALDDLDRNDSAGAIQALRKAVAKAGDARVLSREAEKLIYTEFINEAEEIIGKL